MSIKKTVLDNGIIVITEDMPGAKSAALGFWVNVGSRDENPSNAGISHFMEHMLFKGTPTRDALAISAAFDAIGAELNAFTSKEYTCFYSRMIDEHFDYAFEILADMIKNPLFSQETINPEREVVLEEISRNEDSPEDYVFDVFMDALYPQNKLGRPILGTRDIVGNFCSENMHKYHKEHYTTGNIIIVACGAVSHEKTVEYTNEFLADLRVGARHERDYSIKDKPKMFACATKDTEQAHLLYGMETISVSDPKRFAYNILDACLGGGMSSRLFTEIREKRGLVYAVYTMSQLFDETGAFVMYAGTNPGNIEEILDVTRKEFKKLTQIKIDNEEFERVREFVCGHYALAMESPRNHMVKLGKMALHNMELASVEDTINNLRAVTIDDIFEAANITLSKEPTIAIVSSLEEDKIKGML